MTDNKKNTVKKKRISMEMIEKDEIQSPDAAAAPVIPEKNPLTQKDIEMFRKLLLKKRQELVGDMDVMTEDALKKSRSESSGDLSYMPIHMADVGSDNFEQEFTVGLIKNERDLIKEIDEALARIDKGTYGLCIGTGKPIEKSRLKLKPWAKYCIEYKRESEKKNPTPSSAEDKNTDLT
jgi:RNA polymerase-binding protein DksA